jgi:hypothetical protein
LAKTKLMDCGDLNFSLLTDTLDLPYTNPRQYDMLATDYKSLHLSPSLKLCRVVVVHKPDVIFLLQAYMNRNVKVSFGRDKVQHRGLYLHAMSRDRSAGAKSVNG